MHEHLFPEKNNSDAKQSENPSSEQFSLAIKAARMKLF